MHTVHWRDIKTIRQLYELEGGLTRSSSARYTANSDLLDRISLHQGDITQLEVDAIVNAANKSLLGGGGVDGAIHSAAGSKLLDECRSLNGCLTGQAKITRGYNLPARYVIHTVGPVYASSDIEERAFQLSSCYKNSLELAVENSLKHVAFPCISTGVYGYPIVDATHLALDATRKFCESQAGTKLERIIFVVWGERDANAYRAIIPEYFPPVGSEPTE